MSFYWIKPKGWRFRLYLPKRMWWWVQYFGGSSHARFDGGIHS